MGGKLVGKLASNLLSPSEKPEQPQNYHGGQSTGHQQNHGLAGSLMGGVASMFGGKHGNEGVRVFKPAQRSRIVADICHCRDRITATQTRDRQVEATPVRRQRTTLREAAPGRPHMTNKATRQVTASTVAAKSRGPAMASTAVVAHP
jgi:hypothetical protein